MRIKQNTDAAAEITARIAYDHDGRMTTHKVGHAVGEFLSPVVETLVSDESAPMYWTASGPWT